MTDISKAKKSLGQHFLINKKALLTVAESLKISADDTVIEVGPGHGELTDLLIASPAKKIIVIEKDHELAELLKEKYRSVGTTQGLANRLTVTEGDALKDLAPIIEKLETPYVLAGNIPYYITGYLLRIVGDMQNKPLRTVFTIQKEVALRICAIAPDMNRLAACVQIWGTPHIAMKLKPTDFNPPPSIDSAIIAIETKKDMLSGTSLANYYETVGILFQQPRKTILNNLSSGFDIPKEKALALLKEANLLGTERPENLSIETIQKISNLTH
ncbi:MAG: 16S rRNA (adenine(1518)-N(6)/adenine(1519)-N(6))-dimethyltransferase RsmA [bacterium]|nr:16S rRNA (adenine(1518)-N(6)/adenine(1519)-N(6))-dimethyltransferase RsmA [bacterium]